MPRRFHPALFFFVLPVIGASWWLLPRPTPASPAPTPKTRLVAPPFGVWRGSYTMRPAGLWDESGIVELRVTHQLVHDTVLSRAYRVEARLRSSRYGLLEADGTLRLRKFLPGLGWTLGALRSPVQRGLGAFEVASLPGPSWDGASLGARLVVRTGLGDAGGLLQCGLEGEAAVGRRPSALKWPAFAKRIEVRVERAEMPPSDLRKAIANVAPPGTPEAAEPLPPRAEETPVIVRVLDTAGRPLAGQRVRVVVQPVEGSGGHSGAHSGPRPHGWLLEAGATPWQPGGPRIGSIEAEWMGTTDAAGEIRLRYRAPELGGVETVTAELVHRPEVRAFAELRVGLPLVALPPNPDYFLIGGTVPHPSWDGEAGTNHFVSTKVLPKLAAVASEFRRATGMPLKVNDSSVAWGGVFDIDGGWARPHYNHRDGTDVDLAVLKYGEEGRPLTAPEVTLLAEAIRREGGRPGFEGDHIHASFGPIRSAEGPPRTQPMDELSPEVLQLLQRLDMMLSEPGASPNGAGGTAAPAVKPRPEKPSQTQRTPPAPAGPTAGAGATEPTGKAPASRAGPEPATTPPAGAAVPAAVPQPKPTSPAPDHAAPAKAEEKAKPPGDGAGPSPPAVGSSHAPPTAAPTAPPKAPGDKAPAALDPTPPVPPAPGAAAAEKGEKKDAK